IMIGANLPHEMRSNSTELPDLVSESISIHFKEDFLGEDFSKLFETSVIKEILRKSMRGIKIGNTQEKNLLIDNIQLLINSEGLLKISRLLEIIHTISETPDI